ncbi:MAG: hypothetical protein WCR30_02415 [Clostridia bacterium]
MKDRIFICDLIDTYGELIKPSRLVFLKEYFFENLSMVEIGEIHSVTRQNVYSQILKVTKQLKEFEKKIKFLDLIKKYDILQKNFKNEGINKTYTAAEVSLIIKNALED